MLCPQSTASGLLAAPARRCYSQGATQPAPACRCPPSAPHGASGPSAFASPPCHLQTSEGLKRFSHKASRVTDVTLAKNKINKKGNIWPPSAKDGLDTELWATFVCTTLGLEVPVLSSLPRRNNK